MMRVVMERQPATEPVWDNPDRDRAHSLEEGLR
jgi:hypothetical protein